ncbi:adenosylmethionine decarboxylase [Candidatus Haliotispira prima]|uniref:S-adenosylmethionine decarboxylase proenzyme n=1 Tax=Candidatus Haliotispira prima TaxID=3034016 RepID=A0ABY8MES6_9SPIO|nr:adenosylmethionine decarboxylase [Candidatus Haliotispira prima]
MMTNTTLGHHVLVEMYRCDEKALNDPKFLEKVLCEAAGLAGATIVTQAFHQFNPHGVSGVVVISESHLTIHTWPEHGYASLDLYTCGNSTDTHKAFNYIRSELGARHTSTVELRRGNLEEIESWQEPNIC